MVEFNKEKAVDEILAIFNLGEKPTYLAQFKAMVVVGDYLETLHLNSYKEGLEAGLKKIEIGNDSN
jgi:hypothetical protein